MKSAVGKSAVLESARSCSLELRVTPAFAPFGHFEWPQEWIAAWAADAEPILN